MLDLTGSPTAPDDLERELRTRMAWVVVLGDRGAADRIAALGSGTLRRLILAPATPAVYLVLQGRAGMDLSADGGARAVSVGVRSGKVVDCLRFTEELDESRVFDLWRLAESR